MHEQHLELFEIALGASAHLIVAITNPDTGTLHADPASPHRHTRAANPFTYYERARLIAAALAARGHGQRHSVELAAAQAVAGVEGVRVVRFGPYRRPNIEARDVGLIEVGRNEIARLDNNPSRPDRGVLGINLVGGR